LPVPPFERLELPDAEEGEELPDLFDPDLPDPDPDLPDPALPDPLPLPLDDGRPLLLLLPRADGRLLLTVRRDGAGEADDNDDANVDPVIGGDGVGSNAAVTGDGVGNAAVTGDGFGNAAVTGTFVVAVVVGDAPTQFLVI